MSHIMDFGRRLTKAWVGFSVHMRISISIHLVISWCLIIRIHLSSACGEFDSNSPQPRNGEQILVSVIGGNKENFVPVW